MATKLDFTKLLNSIDKVTKKTYEDDSANYWKPTKDKTGNASALIRFLPSKNIDDVPFVRMFSHSFKDPNTNRWYFENSLTTIGEQDEIGDQNKILWDTNDKANQEIVKLRKRKLQYICNILVIKDGGNPEMNGKVMRYKFGQKIFDKIVAATKPDELSGEVPFNPFDPNDGADFMLKMVKANDQYNYDQSKFTNPRPLFGGDEDEIKTVLDQCFDINEEIAPSKFKTKEELKKKFLWVTGQDKSKESSQPQDDSEEFQKLQEMAKEEPKKVTKPAEEKKKPPVPVQQQDDDDAAFFAGLISD